MESYPGPARALSDAMTAAASAEPSRAVAFQGAPGAYSHQATRERFPGGLPLPCLSFEHAFDAVVEGRAGNAVIPIENSLHGRVADVHFLLPESGLHIVGEHFVRIRHCLLGAPGAAATAVRAAMSHPQALGQCRQTLRALGIRPVAHADTAAAAAQVVEMGDSALAAVASRLAGELYGCALLAEGIEDAAHNTTRFVVLARDAIPAPTGPLITTLMFEVRNVPAALYKALGGFATNGVNLFKLESYLREGFSAAEFYADIEGGPADPAVARAIDELEYHSKWVRVIGTYRAERARG